MDDIRRLVLFVTLSILFAIVWSQVRVALFPPPPQPPAPAVAADDEPQDAAADAPADGETAEDERPEAVVPEHQPTTVVLGGGDVADGYFQRVTLTSAGAAVESIELLDERYCELGKPGQPLKVVGHENDREDARTLDSKLTGLSADVPAGTHWQLVATETDTEDPQINTRATFELAVDGVIARKVYMLRRGNPDARDSEADGYRLEVTLAFKNESETDRTVTYVLQGPTGLPLESLDVGRKFREIELSFVGEDGSVTNDAVMAQQATDQAARNAVAVGAPEEWRSPLRYAGTEVQYFASLLFPQRGDATAIDEPLIDAVYPVVTGVDPEGKPQRNDVSVELRSVPVDVPAGSQVAHRYTLLTAPKRPELFEPVGAGAVLDLGWFWFVSEPMLWLLEGLHSIGIPFGIAIICLTVIVRCGMMPLTLKQVRSAARMKELQPKLEELKKKHGDDREALGRAQMKLWSDEGINPLAGCLPLFVQLPIFIGLYNALNNAVDLRGAGFLWFDNLAAPDHLFYIGFRPGVSLPLPFAGWYEVMLTWFNLLPLLTVFLFYVQQKLFMPPATTPEQEMQFKMMSYMTPLMGFFFYNAPAGLCLYFISSSVWGITERKLLTGSGVANPPPKPAAKKKQAAGGKPGFFGKLLEAVDEAKKQAELNVEKSAADGRGRKPKKR